MEVREITQYNKDAPFTGYGVWVVFELKYRKAHLLHPVHLTELMLSEYELARASGSCLWPFVKPDTSFNWEKFKRDFKDRVRFFIEHNRSFPLQTVAQVISEMDDISVTEAIQEIGQYAISESGKPTPILFDKANRSYALAEDVDLRYFRGRKHALLTIFKENGPSSIYQATHLCKGRLKTKSELGRVVTYLVHRLTTEGVLVIVA